MVAATVEPERLLFVDEMGVHTSLAPIYGYAPKGERLNLSVPRNRGKNTTLLSSMTLLGMGPSLAVQGATTARVFETYVEKVLAPSLEEGQVVVMDNLGAHKPQRVRELIEERGCELLYLPAYSPDYNPIEIDQPQCTCEASPLHRDTQLLSPPSSIHCLWVWYPLGNSCNRRSRSSSASSAHTTQGRP